MKAVCGFNFAGTRSKAADFDPQKSWAELSPHTTWDSAGMSNGLIQDLATAVVHRFICYNITGKKKATKRLPSPSVDYKRSDISLPHSLATSTSLRKHTDYMGKWRFRTSLRCGVSTLISSSRLTLF
ncbi:actin depolymerizing factor 4 [Striga asiatica]|uniref:Actin depolymerizing factor 4 n=1 Tax=Striga asiatica TaxID=4170 RepID=A0A5A7QM12_STRAF|nr:actin depolymerizing factor 4 [Striga asiatica]